MKLGYAKIDGKEYPICLNLRVLKNLQDRTGNSLMDELKSYNENFDVGKFSLLLNDMLNAGYKQAVRLGIETSEPPCLDDLIDLIGVDDFGSIFAAVGEVAKAKPDIETVSKNA